MPSLIAVTGATGFIGEAVCARLLRDGGQVRALVRNPNRAGPRLRGAELVRGDITDPDSVSRFVAGTHAVIHCAGNVRGSTQEQFDRVNVTGLKNLLTALKSTTPGARLLNLSSLAAREPELSFYATSKRRGEELLLAGAAPLEWAALRPPPVYGPGDKELMPLLRLMARGFALIPGSPDARFSLIYVDDLVDVIVRWANAEKPFNGIFAVEDGTRGGYDWKALMNAVGTLSGRRVRRLALPPGTLEAVAWLNRSAARLLGYAPMLTPEKLRELRHPDWVCDGADLREQLGWEPQTQLTAGLKKCLFETV